MFDFINDKPRIEIKFQRKLLRNCNFTGDTGNYYEYVYGCDICLAPLQTPLDC